MRTTPDQALHARRASENPIIRPETLGVDSRNINGPMLWRVPDWVPDRLGRYYLYFSDHRGQHISMAVADDLCGPYRVQPGGVLRIEDAPGCEGHIASPEIWADEATREVRLYVHGPSREQGSQKTFLAHSTDGRQFGAASATVLAPFYLRVFRHGGWFYGVAKHGNVSGVLLRSRDGVTPFERGPEIIPHMRHCALVYRDDTLWIYYSRIGDAPESILLTRWDLRGDWHAWEATATPPRTILSPETNYEGIGFPNAPSTPGPAVDVRQVRDPFVYEEDGRLYLFYTVAGETGIALAELTA
jgi:hypothetical protein